MFMIRADETSAAVVLHECLFGKWKYVERDVEVGTVKRLRELGGIDK